MEQQVDVFVCHASEDKNSFVRPLAEGLRRLGVTVWYDEFSLQLGESISRQIDHGIANAKFGIVVISVHFIGKHWAEHELRGLVNRDIEEDLRILPIWHGVSKQQVLAFSPSLSDKVAIDTQMDNAQEAALKILRTVRPDLYEQSPRAELERQASGEAIANLQSEIEDLRAQISEFQCPICNAPLSTRLDAPVDQEQKHWDIVEAYECGHRHFAGNTLYPCPNDPKFPTWEDYEIACEPANDKSAQQWQCTAWPQTEMARKVNLEVSYGRTEEEAREKLRKTLLYRAGLIGNAEWFRSQAF